MTRIKLISIFFMGLLIGCSNTSTLEKAKNTTEPPPVSIVFAGPVLENTGVKFKFSIVTTNPSASNLLIADGRTQKIIYYEEGAEFKPVQLKNLNGEIVSVFQWTGFTEPMEITSTSPSWLHQKDDTHVQLIAVVTKKGGELVGRTVQTATFSLVAKQQILMAMEYNKDLNINK